MISKQKVLKVLNQYQDIILCQDILECMNEVSFYAPSSNENLIRNMFSSFGKVGCSSTSTSNIIFYVIS